MPEINDKKHRSILRNIAYHAMIERGLLPDFPSDVLLELDKIQGPAVWLEDSTRDLRKLLWSSIDNHDCRYVDQLTVADIIPNKGTKILIAIADVDALVKPGSAIDEHARHNTASIYTAAEVFPMLPEKLSTDLTSLSYAEDRLAIVVEMIIAENGTVKDSNVYKAMVRNYAKLDYHSVAEWLEGNGPILEMIKNVRGLEENLRLQDKAAQKMKALRHLHGALELEIIKSRPVFKKDEIKDLETDYSNRAKDIIADFMIAANGVTAKFLESKGSPSLQRVVHTPKRWDRIVELAFETGFKLPPEPDSKALDKFLVAAKAADPVRFPDLSLSIVKLLGAGEYAVSHKDGSSLGHFGLAVKEYSHSTAPNRRYPDLITQRLLKAVLSGKPVPYTNEELEALARHCTLGEDAAKKVERQVNKSAAAMVLESRIGEIFNGIVTGASNKGTWVRLFNPPVEGRLVEGYDGMDTGHQIRVELIRTDVERGFIDFRKV